MKYDFFVASRWRNKPHVEELVEKLRAKGKTVWCFLEEKPYIKEKDPEKWMEKFESIKDWQKDKIVKQIFKEDMKGLKNSKTLILLLPAGKSAHIEAGVAYGMKKKLILIGEQKETESLYLIFNKMYKTIDEFTSDLK